MNQKPFLIGCGVVLFLLAGNAVTQEYSRIKSRIETTQAKVDALADELKATTKTIHAAIKAITDRIAKSIEQKQVEPIKNVAPPVQPKIVMHSGYSCGPCNAWIATEKAKWEQVGWVVEVIKESETNRNWPWFEIFDRDGRFEVDGPLTKDNFDAQKKARK